MSAPSIPLYWVHTDLGVVEGSRPMPMRTAKDLAAALRGCDFNARIVFSHSVTATEYLNGVNAQRMAAVRQAS